MSSSLSLSIRKRKELEVWIIREKGKCAIRREAEIKASENYTDVKQKMDLSFKPEAGYLHIWPNTTNVFIF